MIILFVNSSYFLDLVLIFSWSILQNTTSVPRFLDFLKLTVTLLSKLVLLQTFWNSYKLYRFLRQFYYYIKMLQLLYMHFYNSLKPMFYKFSYILAIKITVFGFWLTYFINSHWVLSIKTKTKIGMS